MFGNGGKGTFILIIFLCFFALAIWRMAKDQYEVPNYPSTPARQRLQKRPPNCWQSMFSVFTGTKKAIKLTRQLLQLYRFF